MATPTTLVKIVYAYDDHPNVFPLKELFANLGRYVSIIETVETVESQRVLPLLEAIELAVTCGVPATDEDAFWTLRWAASNGLLPIVKFLTPYIKNIDGALISAVVHNHLDVAAFLLESGANPDTQAREYGDEHSIILSTVHAKGLEMMKLLVKHGAPVDYDDLSFLATTRGLTDILQYLKSLP